MIDLGHPLFVTLMGTAAAATVAVAAWFATTLLKTANALNTLLGALAAIQTDQAEHDSRITDLEKWRDESKDRHIARLEAEKEALKIELAAASHMETSPR